MRYLCFDLETTGLDRERDRIMEFCFMEVDAEARPVGEPYTALVDPGRPVPEKIQQITGITPDMFAGKPGFAHHAPRIQRLVQDAILIAHNHRFDVPFLHQELVRAGQPGLPVDHPCIDTCTIERVVNGHGLEACYERYTGRRLEGAHRSQADTEATIAVLQGQMARHAVLGKDLEKLTQPHVQRLRDPDAEVRDWLDHGHRFYKDEKGVARFGFGKHRDEPVARHEGFLNWMMSRDFPADTKAIAQGFLDDLRKPAQKTLA